MMYNIFGIRLHTVSREICKKIMVIGQQRTAVLHACLNLINNSADTGDYGISCMKTGF